MAGQVRALLDKILSERAKGNTSVAMSTKTKLILKGFNPDHWSAASTDDPEVISKVKEIARDLGVTL
jgi:hypothetical protein